MQRQLRRGVPHGGGLFGVWLSVLFVFSFGLGLHLGGDFKCRRRWLAALAWICSANVVQRTLDCVDVTIQPIRSFEFCFEFYPC